SLNMRSRRHSTLTMKSKNNFLFGAVIASLILTTVIIFVPALANAFSFEHISIYEYAVSMGLGFSVIPIVEIVKFFQRRYDRSK
ncbi:MAG: hypothetical protein GX915_03550, partial [Clostridiales bacterium]|nr:hypothetical protein [Clostridiales bacterium]